MVLVGSSFNHVALFLSHNASSSFSFFFSLSIIAFSSSVGARANFFCLTSVTFFPVASSCADFLSYIPHISPTTNLNLSRSICSRWA